jgi:hypothetical protein
VIEILIIVTTTVEDVSCRMCNFLTWEIIVQVMPMHFPWRLLRKNACIISLRLRLSFTRLTEVFNTCFCEFVGARASAGNSHVQVVKTSSSTTSQCSMIDSLLSRENKKKAIKCIWKIEKCENQKLLSDEEYYANTLLSKINFVHLRCALNRHFHDMK